MSLALVLLAILPSPARASTLTVTWTRSGADLDGYSLKDRVEVQPSRAALWETAARGGKCSPEGGRYGTQVDEPTQRRLAELARSVIDEQSPWQADAAKGASRLHRQAQTQLLLERDGSVASSTLTRATGKRALLEAELEAIRLSARPVSALRLSATRKKGARFLRLKLELRGTEPARIYLPSLAREAFAADHGTLRYVSPPRERDVTLTPEKPVVILKLGWKGRESPTQVRYLGVQQRHHAPVDRARGLIPPLEVELCAELGPRG